MKFNTLWNRLNDTLSNTIFHPQYFMKRGEHQTLKTLISLAKKSRNPTFIDIGAGRQWYRNEIEPHMSKYISLDHPQLCKHYQSQYPLDILADIQEKIPVANRSIDLALVIEVLEHLENPQKALINIQKILKTKGLLVLYVFDRYPQHGYPPNFFNFPKKNITSLLESSGFSIKKIISFGNVFETYAISLNICLMEFAKNRCLFLLIFFYPIMLLSNLLALIIGQLQISRDFNISYLFVASKKHKAF